MMETPKKKRGRPKKNTVSAKVKKILAPKPIVNKQPKQRVSHYTKNMPTQAEFDAAREFLSRPNITAPESPTKRPVEGVDICLPYGLVTEEHIAKMQKLITKYEPLIKKALYADELPIIINKEEGAIHFPWITESATDGNHIQACMVLISKLWEYVQTANPRDVPCVITNGNEKYTFHAFLNRIGFIGDKYFSERRTLLEALDGDSGSREDRTRD